MLRSKSTHHTVLAFTKRLKLVANGANICYFSGQIINRIVGVFACAFPWTFNASRHVRAESVAGIYVEKSKFDIMHIEYVVSYAVVTSISCNVTYLVCCPCRVDASYYRANCCDVHLYLTHNVRRYMSKSSNTV